MAAGQFGHGLIFGSMAGGAGRPHIQDRIEVDVQGMVRVVAGGAFRQSVMRFVVGAMAVGAGRDHPFFGRWMGAVTILAAYLSLVRGTVRFNVVDNILVAATTAVGRDRFLEQDRRRFMRGMTIEAILVGHVRRMTFMTLQAVEELAMLGMAIITVKLGVGARYFLHILAGTGMAGEAGRFDVFQLCQVHMRGRMRIVAGFAVFESEMFIFFGIVTDVAVEELTVDSVAVRTIHFRVSTGIFFNCLARTGMAGDTGDPQFLAGVEIDDFRGMRIMTGGAVLQSEVLPLLGIVTHAAFGNDVFSAGGVFLMAIEAADLGMMSSAVSIDLFDNLAVALDTVALFQRKGCDRSKTGSDSKKKITQGKEGDNRPFALHPFPQMFRKAPLTEVPHQQDKLKGRSYTVLILKGSQVP